jgi:SAM-dependent methyltransferase
MSLEKITNHLSSIGSKKERGFYNFLEKDHDFYEGTYTNTINFNPDRLTLKSRLTFWLARAGYVSHIIKFFPKNSILLELGCGGGVRFLGKFYNMIGMDLSSTSLEHLSSYYDVAVRENALIRLPFPDQSLDGVVSSFFWEHIDEKGKQSIFKEIQRVLRPGGKILFLFDVETNNPLIKKFKKKDPALYQKTFLDIDDHVGYATPEHNIEIATNCGFKPVKCYYHEKTYFHEYSVNFKLLNWPDISPVTKIFLRSMKFVAGHKIFGRAYLIFLRILDTILYFLPSSWSRTMTMVLSKK